MRHDERGRDLVLSLPLPAVMSALIGGMLGEPVAPRVFLLSVLSERALRLGAGRFVDLAIEYDSLSEDVRSFGAAHGLLVGGSAALLEAAESLEQLAAGLQLSRFAAHRGQHTPVRNEPCDHAGAELAIDRATGEETCLDCGEPIEAGDVEP